MGFNQKTLSQLLKANANILVDESMQPDIKVISTGLMDLNWALGTGGWVRGACSMVYGREGVGKSSLALEACANALKDGLDVAYIAAEGWMKSDWPWARSFGIDTSGEKFKVFVPQSGEEAFAILDDMVQDNVGLVILDSIGALLGAKEIEKEKGRVGGQSLLITDGVKRIVPKLQFSETCVLFINQARDNLNTQWPPEVYPGGKALGNMCRVIVWLRKGSTIRVEGQSQLDRNIGKTYHATVFKDKFDNGEDTKAQWDYYFMAYKKKPKGFDKALDLITTAKKTGVLADKTWIELSDGTRHNGIDKAAEYIFDHPVIYQEVVDGIFQRLAKEGAKFTLNGHPRK